MSATIQMHVEEPHYHGRTERTEPGCGVGEARGFTEDEVGVVVSGGGGGGAAVIDLNIGIFLPARPNEDAPPAGLATGLETGTTVRPGRASGTAHLG